MSDRVRDALMIGGTLSVAAGLGWLLPPLALLWLGAAAIFAAARARPAAGPAPAPKPDGGS